MRAAERSMQPRMVRATIRGFSQPRGKIIPVQGALVFFKNYKDYMARVYDQHDPAILLEADVMEHCRKAGVAQVHLYIPDGSRVLDLERRAREQPPGTLDPGQRGDLLVCDVATVLRCDVRAIDGRAQYCVPCSQWRFVRHSYHFHRIPDEPHEDVEVRHVTEFDLTYPIRGEITQITQQQWERYAARRAQESLFADEAQGAPAAAAQAMQAMQAMQGEGGEMAEPQVAQRAAPTRAPEASAAQIADDIEREATERQARVQALARDAETAAHKALAFLETLGAFVLEQELLRQGADIVSRWEASADSLAQIAEAGRQAIRSRDASPSAKAGVAYVLGIARQDPDAQRSRPRGGV